MIGDGITAHLEGRFFRVKLNWCARVLAALLSPIACIGQAQVNVNVDLAKSIGPYTPIYRWFGYDESELHHDELRGQLLRELHDLSPEPVYIRAHHLLTSGDGKAELKWSSTNVFS